MPTGRDLLLAHGWMLKQSIRGHFHGKGRNWKRRYFVLTGAGPNGSELRYFENESCSPRELLGSIPITSESHVVNISSAAPPTLRYTGARHDERHMFSLSFTAKTGRVQEVMCGCERPEQRNMVRAAAVRHPPCARPLTCRRWAC